MLLLLCCLNCVLNTLFNKCTPLTTGCSLHSNCLCNGTNSIILCGCCFFFFHESAHRNKDHHLDASKVAYIIAYVTVQCKRDLKIKVRTAEHDFMGFLTADHRATDSHNCTRGARTHRHHKILLRQLNNIAMWGCCTHTHTHTLTLTYASLNILHKPTHCHSIL